ncbi:hypothetical protein [Sporolactobacillus nakayamae]|uniref:Uncharacterized protein n=1 Tax=Sporolactobacillus nakayamae TaxID=269670 RepID=A0A1I2VDG0_9BACL|nr:hypothetical protein [Sporolactobacillus nakayamae]SFG85181.1 hypothetical protein SAMN02982927_02982 [Sporolactobacillus nakayamae]
MHELDHFLQKNFPKLVLAPSLTDQWGASLHFPLAQGIYQFEKDGSL